MLRQHSSKVTGKRKVRFPGIVKAAEVLGVSREHLYRVLTGERQSPLLRRYRDLIKEAKA